MLTATLLLGSVPQAEGYGLCVGGVAVDSLNAHNIGDGSPNISGRACYDPASNTLMLDHATIDIVTPASGEPLIYGIESSLDSLTIVAAGSNQVYGPLVGIAGRQITITGAGSLEAEGQGGGIEVAGLAVEGGCEVTCGSILHSLSANALTVNTSTLVILNPLDESTLPAFTSLGHVELTGCDVVRPAGAVAYDAGAHRLTDNGTISGPVVIAPTVTTTAETGFRKQTTGSTWHRVDGRRLPHPDSPGIYINQQRTVVIP